MGRIISRDPELLCRVDVKYMKEPGRRIKKQKRCTKDRVTRNCIKSSYWEVHTTRIGISRRFKSNSFIVDNSRFTHNKKGPVPYIHTRYWW